MLPAELELSLRQPHPVLVPCGEALRCRLPSMAVRSGLEETQFLPVVSQSIVVLLILLEELKQHLEECLS